MFIDEAQESKQEENQMDSQNMNRNPYQNQEQSQNQNQNSYQSKNSYQTQNPYGNPYQMPKYGPTGKRTGTGFGTAALVLGLISLGLFFSFFNIFLAIIAVIFGLVQVIGYEKKGRAIGGIATAALSLILWATCYGLLFSNVAFLEMVQEEVMNTDNIQEFLEEYGGYSIETEEDTL